MDYVTALTYLGWCTARIDAHSTIHQSESVKWAVFSKIEITLQ
ncbi:hypothetical protein [Williamsia sp. DF01-3]|nr:hypothetical protein [Williamsia sp. DF01-3]